MRAALAAAMFARPDLLLLDEPTNHLSIGAVLWLAHELRTSDVWKERIICIVSHDRCFLDDVTTDVLHVSGVARRLTQTRGNYTTWAERRADQRKTLERTSAVRAKEIDKLKEYAGHGFKYESGRVSDPGRLPHAHTAPVAHRLPRLPAGTAAATSPK